MSSIVLPCLGLGPDQHAMGAPKGTMRLAENVVCDLPNVVRARPSFEELVNKNTGSVLETAALAGNIVPGALTAVVATIGLFPDVFPYVVRLDDGSGGTEEVTIIGKTSGPPALTFDPSTPAVGSYLAGPSSVHLLNLTGYVPRAMHVLGTGTVVVSEDTDGNWRIESGDGVYTGDAEPVDYDARETAFAESRGSLYYCAASGVRRLGALDATATEAAGNELQAWLSPGRLAFQFGVGTIGPFQPGDFTYGYRFVVKRTDANGYVKRSPPSMLFYITGQLSSSDVGIVIAAGPPSGEKSMLIAPGTLQAGDVVEFYRTPFATTLSASLAADLYLAAAYTITSADVTAGYFPPSQVELMDLRENEDLGEALYTNPQRQGALAAKAAPPIAMDIAFWSSCMWHGRTTDRQRLILNFTDVGGGSPSFVGDNASPTATSFGVRRAVGDFTSGSDLITNVTDVDGVVVGAYVALLASDGPFQDPAAGVIPPRTTILAITGSGPYTVQMSADATGNETAKNFVMSDAITIDGVPFAGWNVAPLNIDADGGRQSFYVTGESTYAARRDGTAGWLARVVNDAAVAGLVDVRAYAARGVGNGLPVGASGNVGEVILERTTIGGGPFTVTSTKPMAFETPLGTGITSANEDRQNRLYWSAPDEPEAVPLLNFVDVGAENFPIQRLVPCGPALLVFKGDGLFRVTGSPPGNWSIDQIDTELRLVRPEACAVLEDTVYAWTNRGVVQCDESGVRRSLSAGKIDTVLFQAQGVILGDDSYHGCRILVSARHRLVFLTVPTMGDGSLFASAVVYCWSPTTGAWTSWPATYIRCGDAGTDGVVRIAADNALGTLVWETRRLLDEPRGFDRRYSIESWTATAGLVTLEIDDDERGDWVPTVGDWVAWKIDGGDTYRRVIAAENDGLGNFTLTLDAPAPAGIGDATDRYAFACSPVLLEWLPSSMGTAGISLGVWREATFQMDGLASDLADPATARVTFGVRNDGVATIPTVVATPQRSTVLARPYRIGWPRNASRRPVVAPRLGWSEVYWNWRLSGIALIGELGSEKVRK